MNGNRSILPIIRMSDHGISAFWHAMQCKKAIIYQNIWAKSHKADPDFSTIGCSAHKPDGAAIITYNICEAVLLMLAFCHLTMKTIW